jgi:hypothetical protein
MYLYRALNEFDIKLNPIEHGIYNKKIIKSYIEYQRELIAALLGGSTEIIIPDVEMLYGDVYGELDKRKQSLEKEKKMAFFKETNLSLDELYTRKENNFRKSLEIFGHIKNGSRKDHPWISTSKDFRCIWKYYLDQLQPNVAVINSNLETNAELPLILDLSCDEAIEKSRCLLEDTNFHLNTDFSAFNYTKLDQEVVFFNYIPQKYIITVLDQFEFDLLFNNMLDEDVIYKIKRSQQSNNVVNNIKYNCIRALKTAHKDKLVSLFHKMYIGNISTKELSRTYKLEKLKEMKREILSEVKMDNNLGIKKEKEASLIVLPEDKQTSFGR